MKTLKFYDENHLGDHAYHVHFCRKLLKEYDDINIINYIDEKYHSEINQHIADLDGRIQIKRLQDRPSDAVNSWINSGNFFENFMANRKVLDYVYFDQLYLEFYNQLFGSLGFPKVVEVKEDVLFDNPLIYNKTFDSYDFLIVNSDGFSGQWYNTTKEYDRFIGILKSNGYKMILTKKSEVHPDIETTWDYNCNLLDISGIANNSKFIFGTHTSPFISTLNVKSIKSAIAFINCHNRGLCYSYDNSYCVRNKFDDIYKILKYFIDLDV